MRHTMRAVSQMATEPAGFVAAMMAMGRAKDALFLVYTARNENQLKLQSSEQGQTEMWRQLDHMSVDKLSAEFAKELKDLRFDLRTSDELKGANVPLNRFNFLISTMQVGVTALKDAEKGGQKSKDILKLGLGLGKAIVTGGAGASDAAAAAARLATSGLQERQRASADRVFTTIFYLHKRRLELLQWLKLVGSREMLPEDLARFRLLLCHLQQVTEGDSRWEVASSFVELLGDILVGDKERGPSDLPSDLALWVWAGDRGHDKWGAGSRRLILRGDEHVLCEVSEIIDTDAQGMVATVTPFGGEAGEKLSLEGSQSVEFRGLAFWLCFGEAPALDEQQADSEAENGGTQLFQRLLRDWAGQLSFGDESG
eukprot:COSAG04_NODE_5522_length_1584_cov_1.926322_1_plen_369_part_10